MTIEERLKRLAECSEQTAEITYIFHEAAKGFHVKPTRPAQTASTTLLEALVVAEIHAEFLKYG